MEVETDRDSVNLGSGETGLVQLSIRSICNTTMTVAISYTPYLYYSNSYEVTVEPTEFTLEPGSIQNISIVIRSNGNILESFRESYISLSVRAHMDHPWEGMDEHTAVWMADIELDDDVNAYLVSLPLIVVAGLLLVLRYRSRRARTIPPSSSSERT